MTNITDITIVEALIRTPTVVITAKHNGNTFRLQKGTYTASDAYYCKDPEFFIHLLELHHKDLFMTITIGGKHYTFGQEPTIEPEITKPKVLKIAITGTKMIGKTAFCNAVLGNQYETKYVGHTIPNIYEGTIGQTKVELIEIPEGHSNKSDYDIIVRLTDNDNLVKENWENCDVWSTFDYINGTAKYYTIGIDKKQGINKYVMSCYYKGAKKLANEPIHKFDTLYQSPQDIMTKIVNH